MGLVWFGLVGTIDLAYEDIYTIRGENGWKFSKILCFLRKLLTENNDVMWLSWGSTV